MKKIKALAGWFWRMMRKFWPWYKGLYRGRAWYTKQVSLSFHSSSPSYCTWEQSTSISFGFSEGAQDIFRAFSTRKPTKPRKSIVPMAS